MQLTLNGRVVVASTRSEASLLELLRDEFGLRSMKDGCAPEGSCGACTVIVDGRPVVSCAQPGATRSNSRAKAGCAQVATCTPLVTALMR